MSNLEEILTAMLEDEHADVDVVSRMDAYLAACCTKSGCEGLPDPVSRADQLLYLLAQKIKEDSAGRVDTKKLNNIAGFGSAGKNQDFLTDPNLDTSNVQAWQEAFKGCTYLREITHLKTQRAAELNYVFQNCTNLETVATIDGTNCWSMYGTFDNCTALKNLTIVAGTIQVSLDVSDCTQLTNESLLNVLKGIKRTVGWKTLTLPANKQAVIEADETMSAELAAIRAANWTVTFA